MTKKLTALLMLAFVVAALAVGCNKKPAEGTSTESTPAASSTPAATDTAASATAPADTTKH